MSTEEKHVFFTIRSRILFNVPNSNNNWMLKYGIALLLDGGPTTMVQQSDLINLNPDEPPKKKRTVHVFYTIFFS